MPKLIISRDSLPDIDVYSQKYSLRFRIITDDRNVSSYWSPIFSIDPDFDYVTSEQLVIEKHSEYSTAVWNSTSIEKNGNFLGELSTYDLWVRWGSDPGVGEWQYKERVSSTSINLIKPSTPAGLDHLSVEIYRPARPIIRQRMIDVYQNNSHIDLSNDTITFDEDHPFETGDEITYSVISPDSPIGGLTSNSEYWVRKISNTSLSLHSSQSGAVANTGKIDLTSHPNTVGFFKLTNCTACNFLLYSKYNFSPV
jgi:hypothetical protein